MCVGEVVVRDSAEEVPGASGCADLEVWAALMS